MWQRSSTCVWQVSFGCWVTWSISSWQKCYKSVFFFSFTKFQLLNNKIYSYTKNNYLALGNLVFWSISSFKTKSKHLSQFFLVRGESERIKRINFTENLSISWWDTEKKVLSLITRLGKEETLIILLSAWDRSRDSKAKRKFSKHMSSLICWTWGSFIFLDFIGY